MQHAALQFLTHGERIKKRATVRSWLMSVVANFCKHRRRGRRLGDMPREIPSDEPPPDDMAAAREIAEVAHHAVGERVGGLTALQSSVVALRFWDGMGYGQIASALGLRVAAVRALFHRATVSIRSRPSAMMEWVAKQEGRQWK